MAAARCAVCARACRCGAGYFRTSLLTLRPHAATPQDAASKAQASLQVGASCDEIKHTVEELEAKLSKHYDV